MGEPLPPETVRTMMGLRVNALAHGYSGVRLEVLQRLLDRGDSVVVIEHQLDVIDAADTVIELGPEAGEHGELVARRWQFVGKVALVEDDQRLDLLAFGGEQGARHQFVGERRLAGDDDDDLVDIGGDVLLADFVGAVEQAGAREDGLDHPLVIRGALDVDAVATGDVAALAAREAGQQDAVGKLDDVLATMGGDDAAFHQRVVA